VINTKSLNAVIYSSFFCKAIFFSLELHQKSLFPESSLLLEIASSQLLYSWWEEGEIGRIGLISPIFYKMVAKVLVNILVRLEKIDG